MMPKRLSPYKARPLRVLSEENPGTPVSTLVPYLIAAGIGVVAIGLLLSFSSQSMGIDATDGLVRRNHRNLLSHLSPFRRRLQQIFLRWIGICSFCRRR